MGKLGKMTVVQMVTQADANKVAAEYVRVYGEKDGWGKADTYNKFRRIVREVVGVRSDMVVVVARVGKHIDVSGAHSGVKYAIEYTPWEEWKLQPVDHPEDMDLNQVACHLYYEMTWAGWPEDIADRWRDLVDRADAFAKALDDGSAKTRSVT